MKNYRKLCVCVCFVTREKEKIYILSILQKTSERSVQENMALATRDPFSSG